MKYVKSYKLYESVDDTFDTIKEICFELTDIGYVVKIEKSTPEHEFPNEYRLSIKHSTLWIFDYKDLIEIVDRIKIFLGKKYLITYVEDENYDRRTYFPHRAGNYNIKDSLISSLEIYFKMK